MFQCTNVLACTAWLTDYSPAPHQFRIRLILILLLRHPLLLALFFCFCCLCVPHLRNGRDCRVPLSAACMFFCNGGAPKHQTIVRCPLPFLTLSLLLLQLQHAHTHIKYLHRHRQCSLAATCWHCLLHSATKVDGAKTISATQLKLIVIALYQILLIKLNISLFIITVPLCTAKIII